MKLSQAERNTTVTLRITFVMHNRKLLQLCVCDFVAHEMVPSELGTRSVTTYS